MRTEFSSAQSLVRRAERHIEELRYQVEMFNRLRPYQVFLERQPSMGMDFLKATLNAEVPEQIPCIIFDALNCLRSALDHSVYAAVEVWTKSPAGKYIKFPFGDTEEDFERQFKNGAKGVPEVFRDFFRRLAPFQNGNVALWGLNKLRNSNVHQILEPIGARTGFGMRMGHIGSLTTHNTWDKVRSELLIASSPLGCMGTFEATFSFDLAFTADTPFPRRSTFQTLEQIRKLVTEIVSNLEAEAIRVSG